MTAIQKVIYRRSDTSLLPPVQPLKKYQVLVKDNNPAPTLTETVGSTLLQNESASDKKTRRNKIRSVIGSAIGTAIPIIIMMKQKNIKSPLKMNYGLKDMVILSGSSVAGGVLGGMIGENKETNKKKLKEGTFQFMNASIPTIIAGKALEYCEKTPKLNNAYAKIGAVIASLAIGMYGVIKAANFIFDPKDLRPDRKLTLKDCVVNADDALGALVLAKFPFIDKLHVEKLLPLIYSWCGYRAGTSE